MGDFLGDGLPGHANLPGQAEAKARDAFVGVDHHLEAPRWPALGTVVRVVALVFLLIVVGGWILTLLTG